jgi:hypothetical protein
MKNLLSHLIHLTLITEFEILFYIFYIVPFERKNIYSMFDTELHKYNYNVTYNLPYNSYDSMCNKEEERMEEYNSKLEIICYYYIGCTNFLLLLAFLYDLRKNYYLYSGSINDVPRVLSSPKYLSKAFSLEMVPQDSISEFIDVEEIFRQAEEVKDNDKPKSFTIFYWNKSRLLAKMCETIQLIILLGIFEYIFFTYLFNKFKIVSAKLVLCKLI